MIATDFVQPQLHTERLTLRPFTVQDAPAVQRLAGDIRIAQGTTAVPHPYEDGMAEAWIGSHAALLAQKREIVFAIEERGTADLVGAASLLNLSAAAHARAELGYWVGVDHWSRGYCTEAVEALMRFGHSTLGITRFVGRCLAWNTASAAVMRKAGLQPEGRLVQHEWRDGRFVDQLLFGRVLDERKP